MAKKYSYNLSSLTEHQRRRAAELAHVVSYFHRIVRSEKQFPSDLLTLVALFACPYGYWSDPCCGKIERVDDFTIRARESSNISHEMRFGDKMTRGVHELEFCLVSGGDGYYGGYVAANQAEGNSWPCGHFPGYDGFLNDNPKRYGYGVRVIGMGWAPPFMHNGNVGKKIAAGMNDGDKIRLRLDLNANEFSAQYNSGSWQNSGYVVRDTHLGFYWCAGVARGGQTIRVTDYVFSG